LCVKRFISGLLILSAAFVLTQICAVNAGAAYETEEYKAGKIKMSAKSFCVIEAETGVVAAEYNADERLGMASTTKIMTALVALEKTDFRAVVNIKKEWTGVEGSSIYLKPNQKASLEDLLYGLILESGNDAATAIAGYIAGSVEAFAGLMNEKAKSLGMENTHYANPHGLDADNHYSSARDLAILMRAAMQNTKFVEIAGSKYRNFEDQVWKNHNKLLFNYSGCIAGKTGYTEATGRSLVTMAKRNDMSFIVATLGDPNDWQDHTNAYDWVFSEYTRESITDDDISDLTLAVVGGEFDTVSLTLRGKTAALTIPRGEKLKVTAELPKFVYANVIKGALAGSIRIEIGDKTVRLPVYYSETVLRSDVKKKSIFTSIMGFVGGMNKRLRSQDLIV